MGVKITTFVITALILHWPRKMLLKGPTTCFCLVGFQFTNKLHMSFSYTFIYIYTYFELNKVTKILMIKGKRKNHRKGNSNWCSPAWHAQHKFLAASYFSISCHLRKVKIIFLYYESHKKWSWFILLLVYFLFCSQLCFFNTCLDFRFSLWEFILLFYFPKFQGALYLNQIDPSKIKDIYLA